MAEDGKVELEVGARLLSQLSMRRVCDIQFSGASALVRLCPPDTYLLRVSQGPDGRK